MYYIFLLEKGEPYISLYPIRLKKGEPHKHLQGLLVLDPLPPPWPGPNSMYSDKHFTKYFWVDFVSQWIWTYFLLTPGPNRDLALQNEPQQPMINSDKWMVVLVHYKIGPN